MAFNVAFIVGIAFYKIVPPVKKRGHFEYCASVPAVLRAASSKDMEIITTVLITLQVLI